MTNVGLDESQAGIKIAGRNINNLRYADDTTIMSETKEELKKLLVKVEKSCPITSWQIDGETMETMAAFILKGSKITADGDCSHEIKRCLLLRTYLTSGSTTKPQSSRQYGTVKKTEI